MAGKKHKVQGLRRRWLTGSMGPVLVILLLVGVLISVGFASNYYNSARSTLRAKAAAGADYFNTYVMTSYREYYRSATIYAAAFDDSDKIELQFLNSSGRVEVTTRGVTTGTYPSTPEILRALESGTVQDYIGRDSVTGERIGFDTTLNKGDVLEIYRTTTDKLAVKRTEDGTEENIFSLLDEDSDLLELAPGDNLLKATADSGETSLQVTVRFYPMVSGILPEVIS